MPAQGIGQSIGLQSPVTISSGPPPHDDNRRITETGNIRKTEAADIRILEPTP